MKAKRNSNGDNASRSVSSLSRVGWLTLVLSFASKASAFQGASRISRTVPRGSSTAPHGNENSRSGFVLAPHSRKFSPLQAATRLQFREGDDDHTTQASKWWGSIFSPKEEIGNNEQENVDEYLEFLDRRYKRLHSDEKEEEPKPFSALTSLVQGSQKREVVATQQQQDDALYVLGVAGLASQKLLQKHHLQVEADASAQKRPAPVVDVAASEIVDVAVHSDNDSPYNIFIKKYVVPMIRVLYVLQRRKQLFFAAQVQRTKALFGKVARATTKSLITGPVAASKAVLEIGGGKKTLAATVAAATTLFLLLRPVLKAVVTEGSVSP